MPDIHLTEQEVQTLLRCLNESVELPRGTALSSNAVPRITLDDMEKQHIQRVLKQTGGRVNGKGGAADLLAIHPNTLRHRMRMLGITFGRRAASKRGVRTLGDLIPDCTTCAARPGAKIPMSWNRGKSFPPIIRT